MTSRRLLQGSVRERREVVAAARALSSSGLTPGRSGNISLRSGDGFLITPQGLGGAEMTIDDLVWVAMTGEATGYRTPSSEWRVHLDILAKRQEINAVVHTHSTFATALACRRLGIPAFHYMVAVAGGADIRCAPYATFGTADLSKNAMKALEGRKACLLAHHGALALGGTLAHAVDLAREVETLAEQFWRVLVLGRPKLLSSAEMKQVLKKFETYGCPPEKKEK